MDLITDRTVADVQRWQMLRDKGWAAMTEDERNEWLSPMKGAYNSSDMNRVESAVEEIADRFEAMGHSISLVTKTDWTNADTPTRDDMARYYGNVAKLRSMITVFSTTPAAPSINTKLNYQVANNIEKILLDVNALIDKEIMSWWYAGEIYAGEV